jgi:predicted dehydrogenase
MHGLAIAEQLSKNPARWSIAAVVDASVAAFSRFCSVFPRAKIPFYRSVAEALERESEFDAVHVVTPAPSHVAVARTLVEGGFEGALLIEKPLSSSVAEGERLLRLIEERNWKGRAAVDYHRRCSKLYAGVRERIRSGQHGRLLGIEFSRPCKLSMNGSHFVDLADWFMDSAPASVSAVLEKHSSIDHRGAFFFDPQGTVRVGYQNGLEFTLDARGKADARNRGITVRLEDADLWVNDAESVLEVRTRAGSEKLPSDRGYNALNWGESTLLSLLDSSSEYRPCSLPEALDSLAVIVAAHVSDQNSGRAVDLPLAGQARETELRIA